MPRRQTAIPGRGIVNRRLRTGSFFRGTAKPRADLAVPCRGMMKPRQGIAMPRQGMAMPEKAWLCPGGHGYALMGTRLFRASDVENLARTASRHPTVGAGCAGMPRQVMGRVRQI
jgi:hypothetical protein